MRFSYLLGLFLLLFVSCKSINPEKPKYKGAPVLLPIATSSVNIPIEIPLSYIEANLNKDWSNKLFSGKGMPLGSGIFTDIDVTRTGKITLLGIANNSLKVKIPMKLKGDLKIEKKVFGQMLSTSIPFDELLQPEISFKPEIGRNWDLALNNVKIENWGKSMKYNLMGFEIDLDPIIREQLQAVLSQQLKASNLAGLNFRSLAQTAWNTYGKPYPVEQEGVMTYFFTNPSKLKISEEVTSDQKLKLYLGMEGEVFSQVGSEPKFTPSALPNIYFNDKTENKIDIILPLTIRYKDLDQYLNESLSGQSLKMDNSTQLIPSNLSTQSFGDRILLKMDFRALRKGKKEIKGELYFVAKPIFNPETESIQLEQVDFDVNTKNLLARSGSWMKQGQVIAQITKMAVYPIGDYLRDARKEMQKQGYFETDFATFRIKNPNLEVEGLYNTEEDIRLYLRSTGQMDVRLKELK